MDYFSDLCAFRPRIAGPHRGIGWSSIDGELTIRMLIIGYCYAIRSEHRLCEAVGAHLLYRQFCRLGLKNLGPDHASFSKNRRGGFRDSDAFHELSEAVLRRCIMADLMRGKRFVTDASIVKAGAPVLHESAARANHFPGNGRNQVIQLG